MFPLVVGFVGVGEDQEVKGIWGGALAQVGRGAVTIAPSFPFLHKRSLQPKGIVNEG